MAKSKSLKFLCSDSFYFDDYDENPNLQAVNVDEIKAFFVVRHGDHYNVAVTTRGNDIMVVRSIFKTDFEARKYINDLVHQINNYATKNKEL